MWYSEEMAVDTKTGSVENISPEEQYKIQYEKVLQEVRTHAELYREGGECITCVVKEGDTLGSVLQESGIDPYKRYSLGDVENVLITDYIAALSRIKDPAKISIGESIYIPKCFVEHGKVNKSLKESMQEVKKALPSLYYFQLGDSVDDILGKYNLPSNHPQYALAKKVLEDVNNISDWSKVPDGKRLSIPRAIQEGKFENLNPVIIYKVQSGENATSILEKYNILPSQEEYQEALDELACLNQIEDWTKLSVGAELMIPEWITKSRSEKKVFPKRETQGKIEPEDQQYSGSESLVFPGGIVLEREGPMCFYIVKKGETLGDIVKRMSKQPRFAYLKEAYGDGSWKNRLKGFNINAKHLCEGMRLPIPLKKEERRMTPDQMKSCCAQALGEIQKHPHYGPIVQELVQVYGKDVFLRCLLSVAEQESKLGNVALHRYEPHIESFSYGHYHVLVGDVVTSVKDKDGNVLKTNRRPGTGKLACRNLGITPGELCDPVVGTMGFLADLIEKIASRNDNLSPDKNYDRWKEYVLRKFGDPKGDLAKNASSRARCFPFRSLKEAQSFASLYNGAWQKYNPHYPQNIMNALQGGIKAPSMIAKRVPQKGDYQVQKGDTLSMIARRHGTSVASLLDVNPRLDPRKLQIGQGIILPKGGRMEQYENRETLTAKDAFVMLKNNDFSLYSSGVGGKEDGTSRASNRTGLVGIRRLTVEGTIDLKFKSGITDPFVLTGGTEFGGGHQASKNPNSLSHGNGRKFDIRMNNAGRRLAQYIKQNAIRQKQITFLKRGKRVYPMKYWFKTADYEYQAILESDHIDLAVVRRITSKNIAER